ncbi:14165_t:CDS:2, partial [Funneliformis mosseae]
IILEHQDIISNIKVRNLLENKEFFTTCWHIRSIWAPIKKYINILESNTATLADCFIHMIKLAIAIYQLPNLNPFKIPAIHVFNVCYIEFQHPAYLLCYFIYSQYRGRELRNGGFRDAALIATKLWQSLGHDKQESYELISHLHRFEAHLAPYDLPYIENMNTPEL